MCPASVAPKLSTSTQHGERTPYLMLAYLNVRGLGDHIYARLQVRKGPAGFSEGSPAPHAELPLSSPSLSR